MFQNNKQEIFGFRKYKAYGLASAVVAAFFLMGGVASADEVTSSTTSDATALTTTLSTEASADNATAASGEEVSSNNVVANTTQLSSVETSTNSTGASIQPEDAQSSSESDANTKHFEIETTDVSRATFEERLDALDDLIKTDIARALNDSMGQAVNSYNQIEGVTPITDVPMLTKDDVKLTYNRSILKPVKTGNLYMFTEKPVALAYDVTVPGFITTYQKMIPMVASVRTIVSLPVVMNKFVGESASKPIDEIGRPLDNIGTKIDSLTTTRTIVYNIEGSNDTARSSIHNSITRYTPFFSPSIISYDTKVPGDVPSVEIPQLKVTCYTLEDGTEIKDAEEGFVDAPNTIGKYQFTGTTNTNEGGDIQTHIYKPIETEVPGDAPSVDVPTLKVTRYQTEDGIEIKDSEEGFVDALKTIGDYQFIGVTNMNEGNDVQTHIYSKIVTEIPRESLVLDKIEYKMTRYVDEQGQELTLFDFGLRGPKAIEDYVFTGRTDSNKAGDVLTHVYRKVVVESKLPGDAPQYDIPELKVTRHVDEKGKELIEIEKGIQPSRKTIGENEYTGRTIEKDGITTHVYAPLKHEVPGDAPIVDVPELKVTRYVNEKGEEIKDSEEGFVDAPNMIGEYEFTGKIEFNDGKDVQTHIYKLVEKRVTPIPDPKKPEIPSSRTPEPKKPETPQPEAPKPIETSKSNDSKPVVAESVDQPQFDKDELPKTGETNSKLALVGVSVLTALGLIGFIKLKKREK